MSKRRTTAVAVALIVLAGTLSVAGAAAAVSPAAGTAAPAAVVKTAVPGQPPRNFSVLPGSYFSFPNSTTARNG